jgi:7-cyano-7-deazaguanine synthase in queuosine biosynthesis
MNKKLVQECKKCINTNQNPSIRFNKEGYCHICQTFIKNFSKKSLAKELKFFKSFIGSGKKRYDIMVGLSGGKDSSAALYQIKQMGFKPLAFTLDTGYLHPYIFQRARNVARKMCQVDYKVIPVKKYITKQELKLFRRMAELYSRNKKEEFVKDYGIGRKNYRGVVRPCWVCRKAFIRAYYSEALKHGVRVVILGINEWTSLKQTTQKGNYTISAVRKLKPFSNKPPVYIVHFPFLIQARLKDAKKVLKKMGWNYYRTVQSNAASCLLACAAEKPLYDNLGFHPDTTRLAREVTVGFLSKREAKKALKRVRKCKYSLPQVLKKAGLIDKNVLE